MTSPKATHLLRWLLFTLTALVLSTWLAGCQSYDVLVEKDQTADQKWADVEANLQRRADLVPNLVAVVKGSAKHEEETLEKVTEARSMASSLKLSADDLTDPAKVAAFEKAQENLKGSLSRLLVVDEKYPDLKANAQFQELQKQLEGTENRILIARRDYNAAVKDYNTELGKIRGQVVNKATGKPFKPRVYFNAAPEATAAPKVSF
jgi:LemA protein